MPIKKKLKIRRAISPRVCALFFTIFTAIVFISHAKFFDLPFFWDEVGQFVPGQRLRRSGECCVVRRVGGPDGDGARLHGRLLRGFLATDSLPGQHDVFL